MSHHVLNGLGPPFHYRHGPRNDSIPLEMLVKFDGWDRMDEPALARARTCAPKIDGWCGASVL